MSQPSFFFTTYVSSPSLQKGNLLLHLKHCFYHFQKCYLCSWTQKPVSPNWAIIWKAKRSVANLPHLQSKATATQFTEDSESFIGRKMTMIICISSRKPIFYSHVVAETMSDVQIFICLAASNAVKIDIYEYLVRLTIFCKIVNYCFSTAGLENVIVAAFSTCCPG